jgi:Protein of unknown function (DUF1579)
MSQPQQAKSAPSPDKSAPTSEQVATMKAEPQREHRWLQRLVGDWTYEVVDAPGQPDKPSSKATGTERVRSLGDLWVLAEGEGEMPGGGPATTLMTLGYDPRTKRFVGTWIGSMMTHMWIYDGALDANERALALESEGPAMSGDGLARYRDTIAFKSDDERTLTASVLNPDGTWHSFMTATYRRVSSRA